MLMNLIKCSMNIVKIGQKSDFTWEVYVISRSV